MDATGWEPRGIHVRILKGLWSDRGRMPEWARMAHDRGWMTLAAMLRVPLEPTKGIYELMYEKSAFYRKVTG